MFSFFDLKLLRMVNHIYFSWIMRKAKREMNLSVELITPEQKLEEISLLEDHKYNFMPLNNRCNNSLIKSQRSMAGQTKTI
jgi:hypothetical protein